MKIKNIYFYTSVKCGAKQYAFIASDTHDMELDVKTTLIKITDKKSKDTCYSSLSNMSYFVEEVKEQPKPLTQPSEDVKQENDTAKKKEVKPNVKKRSTNDKKTGTKNTGRTRTKKKQ